MRAESIQNCKWQQQDGENKKQMKYYGIGYEEKEWVKIRQLLVLLSGRCIG